MLTKVIVAAAAAATGLLAVTPAVAPAISAQAPTSVTQDVASVSYLAPAKKKKKKKIVSNSGNVIQRPVQACGNQIGNNNGNINSKSVNKGGKVSCSQSNSVKIKN